MKYYILTTLDDDSNEKMKLFTSQKEVTSYVNILYRCYKHRYNARFHNCTCKPYKITRVYEKTIKKGKH